MVLCRRRGRQDFETGRQASAVTAQTTVVAQLVMVAVQALDGIGAGLQSVAVPALVVRLLRGTGRINVGQGVVMTVQGVGAALSPALGGVLAQHFGYAPAFLVLGAVPTGSLALWLLSGAASKAACGIRRDGEPVACKQ
jgi:MFS family permease